MSGAEVTRRLEPDLRIDAVGEASFYPDEGFVYSRQLAAHLLRVALGAGAEVRPHSAVIGFREQGGRLRTATLAGDEEVQADLFVLCCGRWTERVAAMADVHVPMVSPELRGSPALGFLGYTNSVPARLNRVVSSPGLNVRPDGGGQLLVQALDLDRAADLQSPPSLDSPEAGELLRRTAALFHHIDGSRLDSQRMGSAPSQRMVFRWWAAPTPSMRSMWSPPTVGSHWPLCWRHWRRVRYQTTSKSRFSNLSGRGALT